MHRVRNEHTTAATCEIRGRGYWTGRQVGVTINPAPMGTGIRLVRTDLPGRPWVAAAVANRQDAALRTNLVHGDARFEMVEHLMAALVALEIDNAIIDIDAEELPSLDGSSLGFVDALSRAGLIIQAKAKHRLVIDAVRRVGTADGWVEAAPSYAGECYFEYQLSFDDETPIARQTFGFELTPDRFIREVASARTFITETQANQIRAAGMAAHVTNQDLIVIGDHGPIENKFRFANECARHKTLDLIGDLALADVELVGRFTSYRGGHNLNGQMATLLADLAANQSTSQPAGRPAVNQTDVATIALRRHVA